MDCVFDVRPMMVGTNFDAFFPFPPPKIFAKFYAETKNLCLKKKIPNVSDVMNEMDKKKVEQQRELT